jgi:hypothetical protein
MEVTVGHMTSHKRIVRGDVLRYSLLLQQWTWIPGRITSLCLLLWRSALAACLALTVTNLMRTYYRMETNPEEEKWTVIKTNGCKLRRGNMLEHGGSQGVKVMVPAVIGAISMTGSCLVGMDNRVRLTLRTFSHLFQLLYA